MIEATPDINWAREFIQDHAKGNPLEGYEPTSDQQGTGELNLFLATSLSGLAGRETLETALAEIDDDQAEWDSFDENWEDEPSDS